MKFQKKGGNGLHSIRFYSSRVEDQAGLVATVGEDLEPLVEGGGLRSEKDVPLFEEAEVVLLAGWVAWIDQEMV